MNFYNKTSMLVLAFFGRFFTLWPDKSAVVLLSLGQVSVCISQEIL